MCVMILYTCNSIITVLLGDRGLLYTKTNEKGRRQYQIWYRPMISQGNGTTSDKLLLQTDLKYSSLKMSLSRDKQYVIITNSTRLFTEVYNYYYCHSLVSLCVCDMCIETVYLSVNYAIIHIGIYTFCLKLSVSSGSISCLSIN